MHIGKRKTRNKKEDSPHLYDEIQNKFSKAIDDEDEIVFDATTLHAHTHTMNPCMILLIAMYNHQMKVHYF